MAIVVALAILSLVLLASGVIIYRRCRRNALGLLLITSVVVASIFSGLFAWWLYGFQVAYAIRTSANASPADVSFLQLPPTATHIGFYRNGVYEFAEFNISEAELRRVFNRFTFSEIAERLEVIPNKFGDPKVVPQFYSVKASQFSLAEIDPTVLFVVVTNGLFYSEQFSNNGGYVILYDRSTLRAYYGFSSH